MRILQSRSLRAGGYPVVILCAFALTFGWQAGQCFGMGLETKPDEYNLLEVPLGQSVCVSNKSVEAGKLRITNKSERAYDYEVNILKTKDSGAVLINGFEDIPDTAWITPSERVTRVQTGQTKEIEICVNVPGKKEFAGKKYQAVLEVKTANQGRAEIFVLATRAKFKILTNAPERPRRFWSKWFGKQRRSHAQPKNK